MNSRSTVYSAILCLLVFLAHIGWLNFVADDAYISFRYAKHLADGQGLRFNPGSSPPVEGYTNFLWVVAMAIPSKLPGGPTVWARVLSAACGLALLYRITRFARTRQGLAVGRAAMVAFFFACLPPAAAWSTSGLATMPFALLIFVLYELLLGDPERPRPAGTAIAAVLLVLLRADGIVFVAAVVALGFFRGITGKNRGLRRAAIVVAGSAIATASAHGVFRWAYYGSFVPQTARAKISGSTLVLERGFDYDLSFLLTFPSLLLILIAGTILLAIPKNRTATGTEALLMIAAVFSYSIAVGGDFMCMGRFLVPSLPFFAILLGEVFRRVALPRWSPAIVTAVLVFLSAMPLFDQTVIPASVQQRFHFRWSSKQRISEIEFWKRMKQRSKTWARLGRALKSKTSPGESIVAAAIGAIGYESELFVFDRCGLVTPSVTEVAASTIDRRTAGHEHIVPPTFFLGDQPTILEAVVVPMSLARLLGSEIDLNDPEIRRSYHITVTSLEGVDGFSSDEALRLVRRRP